MRSEVLTALKLSIVVLRAEDGEKCFFEMLIPPDMKSVWSNIDIKYVNFKHNRNHCTITALHAVSSFTLLTMIIAITYCFTISISYDWSWVYNQSPVDFVVKHLNSEVSETLKLAKSYKRSGKSKFPCCFSSFLNILFIKCHHRRCFKTTASDTSCPYFACFCKLVKRISKSDMQQWLESLAGILKSHPQGFRKQAFILKGSTIHFSSLR
jgi:hypothetical protein